MDNQEAIRLIRNLPTMCGFTDAYGEPIDSDAYYEAVDMAISALQVQELKQEVKKLGCTYKPDEGEKDVALIEFFPVSEAINPSAQHEIVRCKDCKHHWIYRCMDSMPTEVCDLNQTFYDPNIDFCSLAERRTDGV